MLRQLIGTLVDILWNNKTEFEIKSSELKALSLKIITLRPNRYKSSPFITYRLERERERERERKREKERDRDREREAFCKWKLKIKIWSKS